MLWKNYQLNIKKIIKKIRIEAEKLIFPSNRIIKGKCNNCGKCCSQIIIVHKGEIIKEESSFEKIRHKDPFYKNMIFIENDNNGYARFTCQLYNGEKCTDYQNRPVICREYPSVKMFRYGADLHEGCGYEVKARRSFSYFMDK